MAARLCAYAEPGQILVAQIACDQCMDMEQSFIDLGEVQLKGFDNSVHVYEANK